MSQNQIHLCSLILRELYGDVIEKVGLHLLKHGATPLRLIAQNTQLRTDQVKKAICTLLQQNLAAFEANVKGFVEYSMDVKKVLLHPRFPRFVYTAKMLYGDMGELLIEEMLQHGQVQMSKVTEKAKARLTEAFQGEKTVSLDEVREKFGNLAQTHFIQRCPGIKEDDESKGQIPNLTLDERDTYAVPDVQAAGSKKRKRNVIEDDDDEDEQPSKRQKQAESSVADEGIYWRINLSRFNQYLRDQAIITAIARRLDKKAAEIVRSILRLSEVKSNPDSPVTTPLSANEIFQALPSELGIGRSVLDQHLTILVDDSSGIVVRTGDSGGGMFSVHFKKALTTLCQAHVESVVRERFGSKCLRIFKLLILKRHLEQKQIEDLAMIPPKEAKELLYRMFGEGFISLTEIPRTPDHAPSRTFYLFSVDLNCIARMLLERTYKAMANLILRRQYETEENKRLLDKQRRVEAIAAQLEQTGADEAQKQEIEEMITPPEKQTIAKVKHMTNKLEQSEIQLDDTIFILQTFLLYAEMKM